MGAIAVVRILGHRNVRTTIADTMEYLNLTKANHCIVVPDTPEVVGMVQKAKDYVTWGSVSVGDVEKLILARGRLVGDKPITDAEVKAHTPFKTVKELAQAIADGKAKLAQFEGIKPIFRLNPPRKGFKGGVKRSVGAHGNLGFRGDKMPELLARMM